jgi:hypothetical protein
MSKVMLFAGQKKSHLLESRLRMTMFVEVVRCRNCEIDFLRRLGIFLITDNMLVSLFRQNTCCCEQRY